MQNKITHVILGGNGFVGSRLRVRLIDAGHHVISVVKETQSYDPKFLDTNSVCTIDDVKKIIEDLPKERLIAVYNCIAFYDPSDSAQNTYKNYFSNFITPMKIMIQLQDRMSLFINLNSFYGIERDSTRQTKTIKYTYDTLYTRTKNYFATEAINLSKGSSMTFVDLVLPAIYGSDSRNKVINILIRAALEKNHVKLDGGNQVWDYLYVEDLIAALLKITDRFANSEIQFNSKAFLIGSDRGIKISNIGKLIDQMTNTKCVSFTGIKRANDIEYYVANSQSFRSEFSWTPKYTLKQGLGEIISDEEK